MFLKWLKPAYFVVLLLFSCVPAYAVATESKVNDSYSSELVQAAHAYNEGEYLKAKQIFEHVLSQALLHEKPVTSIYYNLGAVCYKLEQYDESKSYFSKLITHPTMKAVAYYNLALIENKLSRKKSTLDYLHKSKYASTDKELSGLIDQQLFIISKKKPDRAKKTVKKDWHAYLYLSSGHDSNINFAPLEVASNETGNFFQGIGIFDKRIAGDGHGIKKSALLITSTIFLSNYYSTDFNDYNLFDVGLRYLKPVSKWRNVFEFNLKKSTYGHRDYQQIYATTFKTKRIFSDGGTLRLRYRYEQIESLENLFDYLEGNRQKLRAGYQFKWPEDSIYLWYEVEVNNRNNTISRNYSPTRNTLRLRYETKINATNKVYGQLSQRYSDYEPTPTQDREDQRSDFLLAYVNTLAPDWQLEARWGYRSNRSTESTFSYDRHIILLTLRLTL